MILRWAERLRELILGFHGGQCHVIEQNGTLWSGIAWKDGQRRVKGTGGCAGRSRACGWGRWRAFAVSRMLIMVSMLTMGIR